MSVGLGLCKQVIWIFTNKVKKTKDLHPIILIAASAVIGVVFSMA